LITSLNHGLRESSADLIARMDADDISLPGRFAAQYEFLKNNPGYVVAGCDAEAMDKDGNFLFSLFPPGHSHEEIVSTIDLKVPFIHPATMFRKAAVLTAGGYPLHAIHFEDHLLWKKLLSYGKMINIPEALIRVRFNPESVTLDERWMGRAFRRIRKRSVLRGYVSSEDAEILRTSAFYASQDFKRAAYHEMIGKKYLWNKPDSRMARKELRQSIGYYPFRISGYLLYFFSFVPPSWRVKLYRRLKKNSI
jgi:glycosyltransferase involved in cell wall biosynthesis